MVEELVVLSTSFLNESLFFMNCEIAFPILLFMVGTFSEGVRLK